MPSAARATIVSIEFALTPSAPVPLCRAPVGMEGLGRPEGVRAAQAADQHAGAEMGTQHRSHLGAEQWLATEQLAARGDQALGVGQRLGVLDDPLVRAAVAQLAQVPNHSLEGAAVGADAPDRGDLLAERQDRLDLEGRADHRPRPADPPPLPHVLQRLPPDPTSPAPPVPPTPPLASP